MSQITMEALEEVVRDVIQKELEPIKDVQRQHTGQLVELASDVKKLLDEKTVTNHRLERLEHWAQKAGEKIGVTIEL